MKNGDLGKLYVWRRRFKRLFELVNRYNEMGCGEKRRGFSGRRYWGLKFAFLLWVGIGGNCKSFEQKTLQKLDAGGWF